MIKNLIKNWLFNDSYQPGSNKLTSTVEPLSHDNVTQLFIFPAIGGNIIEFRRYDQAKDRQHTSRYIIKDNDEFADKLSKIITMENLKY